MIQVGRSRTTLRSQRLFFALRSGFAEQGGVLRYEARAVERRGGQRRGRPTHVIMSSQL